MSPAAPESAALSESDSAFSAAAGPVFQQPALAEPVTLELVQSQWVVELGLVFEQGTELGHFAAAVIAGGKPGKKVAVLAA